MNINPAIAEAVTRETLYRNGLDLILDLDRQSSLAALRTLAGAIQFTLINTADWIVRRAAADIARDHTLDERNTQDEWARGTDAENEALDSKGLDVQIDPREKLKQHALLYYGLVEVISERRPTVFERPKAMKDVIADYQPRTTALSAELLAQLEGAELEPGEFTRAGAEARARRAAELNARKPQILDTIAEAGDGADLEQFTQLPAHIQLKLMTSAYKGLFLRRRQMVGYIAQSGKTDELGTVTTMKADLAAIEAWCKQFEERNRLLFDELIDAGITVYGIDDAKHDLAKPRAQ